MANFVSIEEDKFKNKTTYENTKKLSLDGGGDFFPWLQECKVNYRRISMPDMDSLVLDVYGKAYDCSDWPHLRNGQLILLIDEDAVELKPTENWHDCSCYEGKMTYEESVFYTIDEELMKRICNCNSFAMKVYAGSGSFEARNPNAFVVYSKLFYNAVYDNTAYTDVVNNALEQFTRTNADLSNFSKISLDGSGANGGCMGVFLALIAIGGAAISGICSLI